MENILSPCRSGFHLAPIHPPLRDKNSKGFLFLGLPFRTVGGESFYEEKRKDLIDIKVSSSTFIILLKATHYQLIQAKCTEFVAMVGPFLDPALDMASSAHGCKMAFTLIFYPKISAIGTLTKSLKLLRNIMDDSKKEEVLLLLYNPFHVTLFHSLTQYR